MLPKISIITPSYNQGQYIEQTIDSVLSQGYRNLEYILIDGGSTDNTLTIIKKYARYFTYWVSESDNGQSNAINKGFKVATGDIVNWINSDDYYQPGALNHVASTFEDNTVNVYCGRSRVFSEGFEYISDGTDVYEANLLKTIGWARIDQPETFFRKKVWDSLGNLNESFHYVMDKELWIRYLLKYGIKGVISDAQLLANFRIHGRSKTMSMAECFNSETQNLFYSLAVNNNLPIAAKFYLFCKPKKINLFGYDHADINILERSINYYFLLLALESYAKNEFAKARLVNNLINKNLLNSNDIIEL